MSSSPKNLAGVPVLRGGIAQKETYKDFQEEVNMFDKALLEVLGAGDASSRVFTFPIPTYNITPDFDWDNPALEALWEASAKYGIPYFSKARELRHGPGGCAQHVLPLAHRQSPAREARRRALRRGAFFPARLAS